MSQSGRSKSPSLDRQYSTVEKVVRITSDWLFEEKPDLPRSAFRSDREWKAGLEDAAREVAEARQHLLEGRGFARLNERGERVLDEDFVRREGFGYIPTGWKTFVLRLQEQYGITPSELREVELATFSKSAVARAYKAAHGGRGASMDAMERWAEQHHTDDAQMHNGWPMQSWEYDLLDEHERALFDADRFPPHPGGVITIPVPEEYDGRVRYGALIGRSMHPKTRRYSYPKREHPLVNREGALFGQAAEWHHVQATGELLLSEGEFDAASVRFSLRDPSNPDARRMGVMAMGGVQYAGDAFAPERIAALDEQEIRKLREGPLGRLAGITVYVVPDNDEAGLKGALGLIGALSLVGANVRIVRVADGWEKEPAKDMSDLLKLPQFGSAAILRRIHEGRFRRPMDFALEELERRYGNLELLDESGLMVARDTITSFLPLVPEEERQTAAEQASARVLIPAHLLLQGPRAAPRR